MKHRKIFLTGLFVTIFLLAQSRVWANFAVDAVFGSIGSMDGTGLQYFQTIAPFLLLVIVV